MRCAVSPRGTELQDTMAEDKTLGYRWRREEQENVKVFAGWGWGRRAEITRHLGGGINETWKTDCLEGIRKRDGRV